jgi:osmotically-inducible protein OsmY
MAATTHDGSAIADSSLQAEIEEELEWDPTVPDQCIGVSVTEHTVTLAGTVHSLAHRLAAVRAARRVKNVRAIVDEITVVPTGDHCATDESIGLTVERILETNATLPPGLKATVRGGIVTLTGTVEYQHQKNHAARAIREVKGVSAIHNDITLTARASEKVVRSRIVAAIHRSADVDARKIHVTTSGQEVWLSGHAHSLAARTIAENAAWASPGVQKVHSNIQVG